MVGTKTLFMNLGVSYRVAEVILWPPFMALTRRDWRGTENLGKHGEGIVVAPNHISFLDPLIMAHFLHDNGRPPRFMGKQSVFEIPLAGQLIRGAGQIPVSRDKDPHKALAAAEAAVTERGVPGHVPRGHHHPGSGHLADVGQDRCACGWPSRPGRR